jgi:large subunit ribosomal protein L6
MSGTNLFYTWVTLTRLRLNPSKAYPLKWMPRLRQIKVMGYNKEVVGQVAANIRKVRPVEPYLGKGLHYLGEKVRRKAGKSGKGK